MRRGTLRLLVLACLLQGLLAHPAQAAEPTAAPTDAALSSAGTALPPADFVSAHNIRNVLGEARKHRTPLLRSGLRDAALRFEKRLYSRSRIRLAGMYTLLYQDASTGSGPRQAAGSDLDIVATWDAIQRGDRTVGSLELALESRYKVWTKIPPATLSQTIDSLWTTTSGFNVQNFVPTQFYWAQSLMRDRLRFRVGKLSPYTTFFGNRINSSSLFFVNYAFADNPAVFMPGNGLGLHVSYDLSPRWTVHVGTQNANGVKTKFVPQTLRLGEYWHALQVDYHAHIHGLGRGTWRLGGWYAPARTRLGIPEGAGSVLSIDQELGPRIIGFLRYEWQGQALLNPEVRYDALTATSSALRMGVGLPGPLRRLPDDFMGLAVAWGRPADAPVRDSFVAEGFYRIQLESATQLSVSLQGIRSSTIFRDVYVLSVRLRFEF